MKLRLTLFTLLCLLALPCLAKDSEIVLTWPKTGTPVLRFTLGKFNQQGASGKQHFFETTVTIENLSGAPVENALFSVYFSDKDGVRIGEGTIRVQNMAAGGKSRESFAFMTVGLPSTLELQPAVNSTDAKTLVHTVPIKITSVPPGADLRIDGKLVGTTPLVAKMPVGDHTLEFSKDGYATGSTPLDVRADEGPGGSVNFEMGGLSRDAVELRDGTQITGDVLSLTMTEVTIRVNGQEKVYERNRVKKITLVERMPPSTNP